MNKTLLGVLVTIVALVAVGGVVVLNNKDNSATSTSEGSPMQSGQDGMNGAMDNGSMNAGSGNMAQDKNTVVETDKVTMQEFAFVPAKIKVKKGTTVTWTNQDSARHNVAPDSPTADFKEGELIGKDGVYSFTFNTAGTFSYYCSPHPYMKASVEVIE